MAYNSLIRTVLKLPFAGYRVSTTGYYANQSARAAYWASSPIDTYGLDLYFSTTIIYYPDYNNRSHWFSIRCLKN